MVKTTIKLIFASCVVAGLTLSPALAKGKNRGGPPAECQDLPTHAELKAALVAAVQEESSGLDLDMWATIVNRDGVVCAVAFSGADRGAQWPGSRVISAQKANTANAFSLNGLALSTANLYAAVQPGGSLYGLQHSNPVDPSVAYGEQPQNYGQPNDPLVGRFIGGVNVFGGGLALYKRDANGTPKVVGGLGLSGDTSCADHFIAWRVRHHLGLDQLGGLQAIGTNPSSHPDNIIFDISGGVSASGFGHPTCLNTGNPASLPAVQ
jgi:uncharacterized protein GlcG (DUF336 family)